MVPADRKVVVFELIDAVLRSWWTVVAGVCVGVGAALLVLNHTPAIYEATTRLDAFAEMLPTDIIRPTVADDAEVRLKAVQKEVMQQEDLGDQVLARLESPPQDLDAEALAAGIRASTRVNFQTRTRFFDVSYRSSDRYEAAALANIIAELFIEANARQRAELSEVNTRTLEQLAASIFEDLQAKEQEIASYRAAHRFETTDQLPVNQQMLEQRRDDLRSNREAQSAALERIQMIEAQRDEGGVYARPSPRLDTVATPAGEGEARLAELEAELEQLLLRYSENHPDVATVRRQIDEVKARMRAAPRTGGAETREPAETPALDVGELQWRLQLKAARRELDELKEQERSIQRQISQYEGRIAGASHVDATLRERSRGVEALRQQYEKLQRDILAAKGAQQVEERSQGMRFKVVDAAAPPATPVYPNPPLVVGVGALAGLALFVGPSVFRRLLRPLVGSESGLQQLAQVPVLVSIPTIPSPARARSMRRRFLKNFGLSLASVAALAAVTALHYLELL